MGSGTVFSFLLIALCCHGYGAFPAVESTTEGKITTPKGKLEAKAGGISVRFGAYETSDGDELTFPGISNRAFGSFGSSSSSSPSSSSGSSSSSASSSGKRVGGEGVQRPSVLPGRPADLQQIPPSRPSPCRSCCSSSPCGGGPAPPTGGAYIPDQAVYRPPPPPQYGGPDGYFPSFGGNPYPEFVHGGSGSYSNSQASSSSGYDKYGNGYHRGGNQIVPGYPSGGFGQNHGGGPNGYYPARPVGSGSSASSSAGSYAGGGNHGYPGQPGYPGGVPGFNHPYPGGFSGSSSGSFSSSSSSSSSNKGGSYSSSSSQSGSVSGSGRPLRPVVPAPVPEVTPEFSLPDGMCRSSAC